MSRHISVSYYEPLNTKKAGIATLAELWREKGFTVTIGPDYAPDADVCLLHHNLTRLDPATLPRPPDGARVVNGTALDISKRLYSSLILKPGDDWRGPVIVKTNRNYFGLPEARAANKLREHEAKSMAAGAAWGEAGILPYKQYPVLRRITEVPDWVWRDEQLLVERFAPEREDGLFCMRGWIFLGSQGYGYRVFSSEPIVKTANMARYDILDDVPAVLHDYRRQLRLDYGKFDYVQHEGRVFLIDANKTPSLATGAPSPRVRALAEGILDYF